MGFPGVASWASYPFCYRIIPHRTHFCQVVIFSAFLAPGKVITVVTSLADDKLNIVLLIFQENRKLGFHILCKLSPYETVYMKCQILKIQLA